MKKWFRWKGLFFFAGIILVVFLFWVVFLDMILENTIEKYATKANGARVDIGKLDVSLFPVGMKISDLQITDPDSPMNNALQIGGMNFLVDTNQLFRKKIIIDQMSIDQLRLNTTRKISGAIKKKVKTSAPNKKESSNSDSTSKKSKNKDQDKLNLPAFSTPDISSILKNETIPSIGMAEALYSDLRNEKDYWDKTLKKLPDKKKINQYKARLKKIKKKYKKKKKKKSFTALLYATGELSDLKKDVENDLDRLKKASKKFKKQKKIYKKRVNELAKAPEKDIRRIKDKYSITPKGLSNLSRLFIGPKIDHWFQKAIKWYQRIEPYLKKTTLGEKGPETKKPIRGKGVMVKFKEKTPMPDFLVRQARVSMDLKIGSIKGIMKNVTTDPHILGSPLTFNLSGKKMKDIKSVKADGEINYINPSHPKNRIGIAIRKYGIKNIPISEDKKFSVLLGKASGDINIGCKLNKDQFSAIWNSKFNKVRFEPKTSKKPGKVASALVTTLKGIKKFSFRVEAKGTLDQYSIRIKSNLDRILKAAVRNLVLQETARLEKKLNQSIQARLKKPMGKVSKSYKGLDLIGNELIQRLDLENKLLREIDL